MVVEGYEGVILVVLAGYVGADFCELDQLVFHLPRWGLDIGLDSPEELLMVHL